MTTYSNYTQIIEHIGDGKEFIGNTMLGERENYESGFAYRIWSYDTPIALVVVHYKNGNATIYRNERKYSTTTSKHQNVAWRGLGKLHRSLADFNFDVHVVFSGYDDLTVFKIREMRDAFKSEVTA